MRRPGFFLELHAALRQRQRLLGAMLHQRDVGLVAADRREHVAGIHQQRQPLGVPQGGHGFVEPAFLRQGDARERVDHRQMTLVAGGVQRRRRLGDVLADDGGVPDLPVAEPQLVVGEADRPRVVRPLGLADRLGQEGDAARRLATRGGQPAVHPPQPRQLGRLQPLPGFRRSAQCVSRLPDVVLKEPGLGERAANLNLLVAGQSGALQQPREQRRRLGALAPVQGLLRLARKGPTDGTAGSIPRIQARLRRPDQLLPVANR